LAAGAKPVALVELNVASNPIAGDRRVEVVRTNFGDNVTQPRMTEMASIPIKTLAVSEEVGLCVRLIALYFTSDSTIEICA
jgi:uncharacterized protein YcbX